MSMVVSSELRHRQCIDTVILRMGADELHEGDLPTEVESSHQAIVSSRDLEPHTLAVKHLDPNDVVSSRHKSFDRRAREILVGEEAHFKPRSGRLSPSSAYRAHRQGTQ